MANKCLKIENLDNLEELTAEELFFIQGGATVETAKSVEIETAGSMRIKPEELIAYPLPPHPDPVPLPLPVPCYGGRWPYPKPNKIPCVCSPFPTKDGKLPWCAVIL
ncbi:MAG: hypothetical protein AAGI69_24675 [Cyanobacteria bacterium P01_H01_bin.21]